jgi:hypothetical protein
VVGVRLPPTPWKRRRRLGEVLHPLSLTRLGLAYYCVLIVAIVVGVVVGGGIGTTVTAIAGALLALTLLAAGGGVGIAERAAIDGRGRPYDRPPDDDDERGYRE